MICLPSWVNLHFTKLLLNVVWCGVKYAAICFIFSSVGCLIMFHKDQVPHYGIAMRTFEVILFEGQYYPYSLHETDESLDFFFTCKL